MFPKKFFAGLLLPCLLALPGLAVGGTVSGDLGFLGEIVPALRIHAWQPGTGQHLVFTTQRQAKRYTMQLPAGRWVLFARPNEPGAPDLYGAYSRFAACARNPQALRAGACSDHSLVEVQVWKTGRVDGVDLTDWYLDDASAARLDTVMGRGAGESYTEAALAAPRFSEYPATLLPPGTATTTVDADSADPRLQRDQAAIAAALAKGPNFAGVLSLFAVPGGTAATATAMAPLAMAPLARPSSGQQRPGNGQALALLDLRSGQVRWPMALAEASLDNPCVDASAEHGPVQFRRDSRLLTVTRQESEQLVTRYLVWNDTKGRLEEVASLSSALPERCRPAHGTR